jgi:mono/diheme cytochrome c family protein
MTVIQDINKKIIAIVLALVLCLGSIGYQAYYHLIRPELISQTSLVDNYKYGSVGNDDTEIPYWIWLILPRIFSDMLPHPGGYTALGFTWEAGQETPVGVSKQTIGYPRISLNCAVCHSGTYRATATTPPVILPTAASSKFDYERYRQFLATAAADSRFTADYLLDTIKYNHELSLFENLFYRWWLIPRTREKLLALNSNNRWEKVENIKPIWHQDNLTYHGDQFLPQNSAPADLPGVATYLRQTPPPPYPFAIDQSVADQGSQIFQANCATCHTSTNLAGIWSSAPYLANGSVPTLADLLTKPTARPNKFYRGYDVYDTDQVGFIATGSAAAKNGFPYMSSPQPEHNYGTDLSANQQKTLIEYLKTL